MLKQLFDALNPFFHNKQVKTTGFAFKCLTRITVNILIASVLIISMKQYFGDPIQCIADAGFGPYMALKCWVDGVFLDRNLFNYTNDQAIAIGVGSAPFKNLGACIKNGFVHQNYYQWVVPVLALEAILLFLPRVLWHMWENNIMENLLSGADAPFCTLEWNSKRDFIIRYLNEVQKRFHQIYFIKYVFCELLAFCVLILNMFIMHWVFNGFWTEFRPAIAALLSQDLVNFSRYSARLFPFQAKCFMKTYGSSGSLQYIDGLCFLPQNTINEKIFVFLYFWFIAMAILGSLNLVRIFVMIIFRFVRVQDVRRMANCDRTRRSEEFYYTCGDFGIWHTLCIFNRNLSPVLFKDFMKSLMKREDGTSASFGVYYGDNFKRSADEVEEEKKENQLDLA